MPFRFLIAAALAAGLLTAPAASVQAKPLTVVELFTSQGCSSCPPADAFLQDLTKEDGILALSFHVDYWDYIGWKDPYSSPEATARQRAYAHSFKSRQVYTPQMVIDGRYGEVGSHRHKVRSKIDTVRGLEKAEVAIDASGERIDIKVGDYGKPLAEKIGVYLVLLDRKHETQVRRGENAGRYLENRNVVREVRWVGDWNGQATELSVEKAAVAGIGDRCAVILQSADMGPIYGAALADLN